MIHSRGRPYDSEIDKRLFEVTKSMLASDGFENLSVSQIVIESGTTRSAFYRRYKDLSALVLAVLLHEFPTDLTKEFDTGSLPDDLRAIQEDQLDFFTTPLVYRGLSGFLAQLRSEDSQRQQFAEYFLHLRREATRLIIDRAVERGEIKNGYDPDLICDIITGPFIFRTILPETGPLDTTLVNGTVKAALGVLGYQRDA
ncbi:MAG: TetR-like C-terminal domain-containing protein [Ancrocorticia sp.]|uniref:TetR-like C-terminal domain-containing protein n=1 Tax=Ancrocorticia sp. TaxID=2593684 RepID=UPI003F8E75B0